MRIEITKIMRQESWMKTPMPTYTAKWEDYDFYGKHPTGERFDEDGDCRECGNSEGICECTEDSPDSVRGRVGSGSTPAEAVLDLLEDHPGTEGWDFSCLGCY